MNQNYSHSLAPKYSILLDPSGRMNIQQTILTVTTTINSNKVQIKTLIQTERKNSILSNGISLSFITKYLQDLQVGVTASPHFNICESKVDLLQQVRVQSLPILSISIVLNCPRQCLDHITDHPWHHYRASADTGTSHQMMRVRSNLAHHHHNCPLHCSLRTLETTLQFGY